MSGTPECVWHGHWPSPPIWVRIPVSFQYESIRVLVECMDVSQCCIFFLFFLQSASDFSLLFRFMWSSWRRFLSVINLQANPHGVLPFSIPQRIRNKVEQLGSTGESTPAPYYILTPAHTSFIFFLLHVGGICMGRQCIHGLRCHDKPIHAAYA